MFAPLELIESLGGVLFEVTPLQSVFIDLLEEFLLSVVAFLSSTLGSELSGNVVSAQIPRAFNLPSFLIHFSISNYE